MSIFGTVCRLLTASGAALLLTLSVSGPASAARAYGNFYQDTRIDSDCTNFAFCQIFFAKMKEGINLKVSSVSCIVTVQGSGYPDLLISAALGGYGGGSRERMYLGTVYVTQYTETKVTYQLYVPQVNFIVGDETRPIIELNFSTAPQNARANCGLTGELFAN